MILDLSVVWIILFVLLLTVLLDRLLLRPITRVVAQREEVVRSARDLAAASRAKAQAATDEFEARTRGARVELYRQMEERRRAALDRRAEVVADTRREVERSIEDATTRVQSQAAAARTQLERDAKTLATTIVERLLGRKAS